MFCGCVLAGATFEVEFIGGNMAVDPGSGGGPYGAAKDRCRSVCRGRRGCRNCGDSGCSGIWPPGGVGGGLG